MAKEMKSVIEPETDPMEELVWYTAPLGADPDHSRPIVVTVNGESIAIQRGIPVQIKRKFYEARRNAEEQQMEAYRNRMIAMQAADKPMAELKR